MKQNHGDADDIAARFVKDDVDTVEDALAGTRDIIEDPPDLGGREVGVEHEPSALAHQLLMTRRPQLLAAIRGPSILPDDRVAKGLAGDAIPEHDRLALIRDADGSHLVGLNGFLK